MTLLVTREGFVQIYPGSIDLEQDHITHRRNLINTDAYDELFPPFDLDHDAALGFYRVTAIDGTDISRHGQEARDPVLLWDLNVVGVSQFSTWAEILAAHPNFSEWGERGWRRPEFGDNPRGMELVSAARADELGKTTAGKTAVGEYLPSGADWTFRPWNNDRPSPIPLFALATLAAK